MFVFFVLFSVSLVSLFVRLVFVVVVVVFVLVCVCVNVCVCVCVCARVINMKTLPIV